MEHRLSKLLQFADYQEVIIGGNGGNWAFFSKAKDLIGKFIQEKQITAMQPATIKSFTDFGIRGGNKAHLHYDGKIYPLDNKQWADFSHQIIEDVKTKLGKVKEVGFEEGMLLGSMSQQTLGKE